MPSARRRLGARTLGLGVILILGIVAYAVALARFDVQEEPLEDNFGAATADAAMHVYLEPMSVDAVNGSMQVRISFLPTTGNGQVDPAIAKRDMILRIDHDGRIDELAVGNGRPLPEATYRIGFEQGSVRAYPLDRYQARLVLTCLDASPQGTRAMLPMHLTTWEGILGFVVRGSRRTASPTAEIELSLDIQRTGAFAFIALIIYAAMIVMGTSALVIGALVFIGTRTVEVTLIGAVSSMIFALFAMRQALPGSPPLGVRADVLVFFWAQLAAAVGMCLFMVAWTIRGSSGPPPAPKR